MPVIESGQDLEYQITTNLKKLNRTDNLIIAWLADKPGELAADKYSLIKKELNKQYQLIETDLTEENLSSINDAKVLVVALNQDLSDKQKYSVDQFVLKGGSLIYLKDQVIVKDGLVSEEARPVLDDLIAAFGVKIEKNLVLDSQSGQASFSAGLFQFITQYQFWPKIDTNGFNQKSIITSRLESLVLPWVSSLSSELKEEGETTFTPLVKSSSRSWLADRNFNLSPQQRFSPADGDLESRVLIGLISGKLSSYFNNQSKLSSDFVSSAPKARVMVAGDSDFLSDTFLNMYPENLILAENLIDFSVQDEDLISLRSRGATDRPLAELSESTRSEIRYGNIFAMPLLVVFFGAARFFYQSRSQRRNPLGL